MNGVVFGCGLEAVVLGSFDWSFVLECVWCKSDDYDMVEMLVLLPSLIPLTEIYNKNQISWSWLVLADHKAIYICFG